MRIVIGGASGFVGTELLAQLGEAGHEVVRLVRREAGSGESRWDPAHGEIDAAVVEAADAVINLSGFLAPAGVPGTAPADDRLADFEIPDISDTARTMRSFPNTSCSPRPRGWKSTRG